MPGCAVAGCAGETCHRVGDGGRAGTTASCTLRKGPAPPGTHQLLLALNDGQRRLVGVAVLPARVPVSRFLREEVALPPVEQPVLRAGGLALDAALGSCGERGRRAQLRPQRWPRSIRRRPWPRLAPEDPRSAPRSSLHLPQLWGPWLSWRMQTSSQVSASHSAWRVEGWGPNAQGRGIWEAGRGATTRGCDSRSVPWLRSPLSSLRQKPQKLRLGGPSPPARAGPICRLEGPARVGHTLILSEAPSPSTELLESSFQF